ncbi:MAG: ABC transporter ATP-binding protein, partial [Firmicutes bacterium]|nr:ABC transporter ATP-binding protein [Bacillota bacterium]
YAGSEQKEFETIEQDIEKLEERLAACEAEMTENAGDYGRLMELTEEKERLDTLLLEKMERWEYLSELAERIAQSR